MRVRLKPPLKGAADQSARADLPADFNPPGFLRDMLPHQAADGRRVLGVRPGLSRVFANHQASGKPASVMGVVSRSLQVVQGWGARQSGFAVDEASVGSVPVVIPTGMAASVFALDGGVLQGFADATNPAIGAFGRKGYNDGTVWTGGSLSLGGIWKKVENDYGGAVGVKVIGRVTCFKAGTGSNVLDVDFTVDIEDREPGVAVATGAQPIQVEACVLVGPYLLVAAGRWLYCFDARPASSLNLGGRYLDRTDMSGFAWTVEDVDAWAEAPTGTLGTAEYRAARGFAFVAYRGKPTIEGFVTTDTYLEGSYIRSAVEQVLLEFPLTDTGLAPARPLRIGDASFFKRGAPKPYPHNEDQTAFRPAEHVHYKGRGIVSLCATGPFRDDWTGEVMLATANEGFAEPGTPDGFDGYWNFLRVTHNGTSPVFATEDVSSRKTNWLGTGWLNDIPWDITGGILANTQVGPESSLACIRQTPGGYWLAGSFADGASIRGRVLFTSGSQPSYPERWVTNLGTHVGRGAMDAEYWPERGVNHVVAVGTRNNAWAGSGAAFASVWLLNARNGTIIKQWDLGAGRSARSAAFVRVNNRSVLLVAHQIT